MDAKTTVNRRRIYGASLRWVHETPVLPESSSNTDPRRSLPWHPHAPALPADLPEFVSPCVCAGASRTAVEVVGYFGEAVTAVDSLDGRGGQAEVALVGGDERR